MKQIKKMVDQEAGQLASLLSEVRESMERIARLREYRGQALGIEGVELDRLTGLCESYLDDINILHKTVGYLTQERVEGTLCQNAEGRYGLEGLDVVLKENDPIELLLDSVWQMGRLRQDPASGELYFLGIDSAKHSLEPGLPVAVRLASISRSNNCSGHQH